MKNLRVSIIIILLLAYFTLDIEQKLYAYTYSLHYSSDFTFQLSLGTIATEINNIPNGSDEEKKIPFALMDASKEVSWKDYSSENSNETFDETGKNAYTTEGCNHGYGYKVDDENPICVPLEQMSGLENNESKSPIFCDALGCPYSPPRP